MDKKYFFFDIDGTLYSSTLGILPSTYEAIRLLQKEHFVALASGRCLGGVEEIAKELQINNIVCDGGLSGYCDGKNIFSQSLDQKIVLKAQACAEALNLAFGVSDIDYFYCEDEALLAKIRLTHPWLKKAEVNCEIKNLDIKKFFILIQDPQSLLALNFTDDINTLYFQEAQLLVSDQDLKYQGIKEMLKYLNADLLQVVVLGDSENDVQMFKQAPISICMGQAKVEVKQHATYVCESVDEDGIYKALKRGGWI